LSWCFCSGKVHLFQHGKAATDDAGLCKLKKIAFQSVIHLDGAVRIVEIFIA